MARYWVGDAVGGDNWSNANAWAAASGGAGGAGVPIAGDDVYFDALSLRSCTVDVATAALNRLDCTNFAQTLTQSATITVSGLTLTFSAGMTFTHNSNLIDLTAAAGTVAITSAGKQLGSLRVGNVAVGGTYQLQDALDVLLDLDCVRGTFQFNNQNAVIRRDLYARATMVANGIALGSGTIEVKRDCEFRILNVISAGTSDFRVTGTGAMRIYGNTGQTFYKLYLAAPGQTVTLSQNAAAFGGFIVSNVFTSGSGTIQAGGGSAAYLSSLTVRYSTGGPAVPIDMDAGCTFSLTPSANGLGFSAAAAGQTGTFTFRLPTTLNAPFAIGGNTNGNTTFRLGRSCTVLSFSAGDGSSSGGPEVVDLNGFNLTVTNDMALPPSGQAGMALNVGNSVLAVNRDLILDWCISGNVGLGFYVKVGATGIVNVGRDVFLNRAASSTALGFYFAPGALMTVGRNWDSSNANNKGPTFHIQDNGTVRFTSAVPFTIAIRAADPWPTMEFTGGGSVTLPNGLNCLNLTVVAGLITAGNPLTVRNQLTNGGTFTGGGGNIYIGSGFVNTGTYVGAGTNVVCTGALCNLSGFNPVTLTMRPTCLRLQILTAMSIGTFIIEDRIVAGVVQYLAGATYTIGTMNSQIVCSDGSVQMISSVAGTRYKWNVTTAMTSIANLWPRDNDASASPVAPVGNISNKNLKNNLGWTLVNPGQISVISDDPGADLLAAGGIGPMQYCWLVDTTLVGLTAKAAAFGTGANNWHRKSVLPFIILDNLNLGTVYYVALGVKDSKNNRLAPNVGAGDYVKKQASTSEGGRRSGYNPAVASPHTAWGV